MPPEAMASSVVDTMVSAASPPVRSWARSASSSIEGWGNLGADPNPPQAGSYAACSAAKPPCRSSAESATGRPAIASVEGICTLATTAPTSSSAWPMTSSRRSRQAASMACRTVVKLGIPPRSPLGK